MTDYADDVVDLLQELGIERAVIGGCSMGGYAALALYQAAPASFERPGAGKHARRRGFDRVARESPQHAGARRP